MQNGAAMNKPAAKEPSMDEILSSIRQIIADDDAGIAESSAGQAAPAGFDIPDDIAEGLDMTESAGDESDALELSEEQIVNGQDADDLRFDIPDIESQLAEDDDSSGEEDSDFTVPDLVMPDDIAFDTDKRPASVADAAPMPDPNLSSDLASRLLEPATDAAVKTAFARLGNATLATEGQLTIEAMIRDMLRPMLKGWLDENLPGMVEKIVEKEIERLSRGN